MIVSSSNQRIKEARKLQRRRARYQQGRVLLEGLRLVRDAWQAEARFEQLFFVPENVVAVDEVGEVVRALEAAGVECLPCSPEVFATLSETVTPQGIAATVALPELPVPEPRRLTLVLDQVRDPGNAGSLLRSAAAAGVALTIFGPGTVDPFNEKVMRAAMGAHFRTPMRVVESWEQLATWIEPGVPMYLADAAGALEYDQVDWTHPAILVVGGEANGASEWIRARATAVAIPMAQATESLNAAVAASVVLFEAARQRRRAL